MPTFALASLALALIAAVIGIGGMSGPVATIAELLFVVFAAVFVFAVLLGGGVPSSEPQRQERPGTGRRSA